MMHFHHHHHRNLYCHHCNHVHHHRYRRPHHRIQIPYFPWQINLGHRWHHRLRRNARFHCCLPNHCCHRPHEIPILLLFWIPRNIRILHHQMQGPTRDYFHHHHHDRPTIQHNTPHGAKKHFGNCWKRRLHRIIQVVQRNMLCHYVQHVMCLAQSSLSSAGTSFHFQSETIIYVRYHMPPGGPESYPQCAKHIRAPHARTLTT